MLFESVFQMVLYFVILFEIKHFIADFAIQAYFPKYFTNKHTYLSLGGLRHAAVHGLLTGVICLIHDNWVYTYYLATADFFIHYHIDVVKSKICYLFKLDPATPLRRTIVGIDQLLHQLTHFAFVYILLTRWGM